MNRGNVPQRINFCVGLAWRGGKWFIQVGEGYIPLEKVSGPLRNALVKAGSALETATTKMALPGALVAGIVIGAYFGTRGKQKEKEGRLTAESAAEELLREQEALLQNNEELERQFHRGYELTIPVTPAIRASLRENLDIRDSDINIAVVGRVSSGKTSLINSCRGIFPSHPLQYDIEDPEYSAGRVGNRQVTRERSRYRCISTPNIAWWDMPGIGGDGDTWSQHYYKTFNLTCYDYVVLLHSDPFTQFEATIMLQYFASCEEMLNPPPLLIVRTMADLNLAKTADNEELEGEVLLERFRLDNAEDILPYSEGHGLLIFLVSKTGLWEAFTGMASGRDGEFVE